MTAPSHLSVDTGFLSDEETDAGFVPVQPLPFWRLICVSANQTSVQVVSALLTLIGFPLVRHLGFASWVYPLVQTSDFFSGILVQPFVGVLSDRCCSKLGRRRPFIIGSVCSLTFFFLFLFFGAPVSLLLKEEQRLAWSRAIFLISWLGINISINVLSAPARSVMLDLCPPGQRLIGNSIAAFVSCLISGLLFLIGHFRISERIDGVISDEQLAIVIGAGLIIISAVLTCTAADEIQRSAPPPRSNAFIESFRALGDMSTAIRRVGIVYFFMWMALGAFQSVLTDFFGKEVFGGNPAEDQPYGDGAAYGMLVYAVAYGLALVYLPFNSRFVRAVGFANTIAVAAMITILSYSAGFWSTDKGVLMGFFALSALQAGVVFCLPPSMVALIAPPEHFGKYEGALAFFGMAGAEMSDVIFQYGIGLGFGKQGIVIGSLSVASVAVIVASRFLIEPEME